jgi:hypothetical protein
MKQTRGHARLRVTRFGAALPTLQTTPLPQVFPDERHHPGEHVAGLRQIRRAAGVARSASMYSSAISPPALR